MIRSILIVLFIIYSINSNPVERDGNEVCELKGFFVTKNKYGWAKRGNQIICTCPDGQYTIDKPCRICDREDICGENSLCSEELAISEPTARFICFCASGGYLLGEKCPAVTGTTTITPTTIAPVTTTTSIVQATTTTTAVDLTTTTTTTTQTTTSTTTQTITITTQTTTTSTTTQTTTNTSTETSTTPGCAPRSSSSRPFMQPTIIILLNLIYFFTK
ncbi:unnamed protein product [Adineta ricciae]|uniref:Uncharacterized protein n=1 Tax=Adineta ricciae TaxID=249248 RepID=A0A816B5H8_ADIRI|nr:unnamed protein product [Adineta ricciae]CAF1604516.1 unnamed protein product [Adineta ricciae]